MSIPVVDADPKMHYGVWCIEYVTTTDKASIPEYSPSLMRTQSVIG